MTIKTLTKPRERRKISTYDFEWYHGEAREWSKDTRYRDPDTGRMRAGQKHYVSREPRLRLCGFYDERGYWADETISGFCERVLTQANAGRRIYAHFGGASDMVFLLRELVKDESLMMKGVFSSSSLIYLRVERGPLWWEFIDSFWTMRVPLAKIGDWLGLPKLDCDTETATIAELTTYNERDCVVLYQALKGMEDILWDAGGELGVTAASTALKLYLRRFHKRPIHNGPSIDDFCRPGYVASRVEPIRAKCDAAHYYDINSSFPFSMTKPLPGSVMPTASTSRIPEADNALWVADCDIHVPSSEYLPAVPLKLGGRVFFPTGDFRARICSEDLLCGGFEIRKVYQVMRFEPHNDMAEFAQTLYDLRMRGSGFEAPVFKIVVNGGYGKFAERDEKKGLLIRPGKRDIGTQEMVSPGIYMTTEIIDIPHSHVPFSQFTTARSRRYLLCGTPGAPRSGMRYAAKHGKLYYADCDAALCDAAFTTSAELGGWKDEGSIRNGVFYAPKLYAYEDHLGASIVKAKGFSRKVSEAGDREKLRYEDFVALMDGERIRIERMKRIRELVRSDGWLYKPETIEHDKGLSRVQIPKREPMRDGDSRPWSYSALLKKGLRLEQDL